jgi:glycosyltransferase involved in cell wall biosynthesis
VNSYKFAQQSDGVRIGVNTRLLLKDKLEGIGWFTYQTLKRICINHPEHQFEFFFDRAFDESFIFSDNVTGHKISPQARHPVLFKIWSDWSVRRALEKHKIDLYLSPDGMLPLKTDIPCVAVIHDLNFEHYPGDLPVSHSKYYRDRYPQFARLAERVATVSEFSKKDMCELYNLNPSKIDVVFNGVNDTFGPSTAEQIVETRRRFSDGAPYFVFVGSLHPRKNIHRLFSAFDAFRNQNSEKVKLVIVGNKFWWNDEIRNAFDGMTYSEDVVFTGRLYDDELSRVVGASVAMTYVPYFEGFGIPILEAFKCGVPLITSNRTSMPEVAGDAAILVDPFSVEEITEAINRVWSDKVLRDSLVKKGAERLSVFSWNKTADLLWKSIEKVIDKEQVAQEL